MAHDAVQDVKEGPMVQREIAAPEFDRYAGSYDELLTDPVRAKFARDPLHFHRRKWDLMQRLLTQLGRSPATQRWIDVGCGRGELLGIAGAEFAEASGCDPSGEMLPAWVGTPMIRQTSPAELPFSDAQADLITAVCVFHHVHGNDRGELCREIARVLRPNGLCCIMEHNPLNPFTQAIVRRCPVDVDAELLSAGHAAKLLAAAGLELVSTHYFLFLPEQMYGSCRSLEDKLERLPLGGQYAVLARKAA